MNGLLVNKTGIALRKSKSGDRGQLSSSETAYDVDLNDVRGPLEKKKIVLKSIKVKGNSTQALAYIFLYIQVAWY